MQRGRWGYCLFCRDDLAVDEREAHALVQADQVAQVILRERVVRSGSHDRTGRRRTAEGDLQRAGQSRGDIQAGRLAGIVPEERGILQGLQAVQSAEPLWHE